MDKLDAPDQTRPDTVTLAEAARRLGVSTDAIRKRLKRGQLQGYKADSGRWYVILAPSVDKPGPDTGQTRPPRDDTLVEELRREVARLERDLDFQQRLVAELVSRVPQIPERTTPAEPEEAPRRAWWRVWKR